MARKKAATNEDVRGSYEGQLLIAERLLELQRKEMEGLNGIFNIRKKLEASQGIMNTEQGKLNDIIAGEKSLLNDNLKVTDKKQKMFKDAYALQLKSYKQAEKEYLIQRKKVIAAEQYAKAGQEYTGIMKKAGSSILKYLFESDVAIKNLNLGLGLSGERSEQMVENLSAAAPFAASMGVNMKTLAEMAATYADETGRARILNEESLKSMSLIAEGTNLGAEGAARMAGQYEMMGFNATDTSKEVQRIVDTTERMGVNTGKVLKVVGSNFKKLQKYSFRNGVAGMADMAIYAAKFKMDMNEIFEPLEKGRHLDSVIEMSAQLQVLGGNFSNLADPMSMLFESRNDPKAYMKRINEMTKGMVTMQKVGDEFQLGIASPMAQDQLAQAAKALGMSTDELTTQAHRATEIQETRKAMFSQGFTNKEKEVIEGLAKFDTKSGKMIVEVGTTAKHISDLTSQDIKAMEAQKSSLEARGKAAQGFDEAFQNTIMELKASFLPLLKGINSTFTSVREFITPLLTWFDKLGGVSQGLLIAGTAIGLGATQLGIAFVKGKALGFLDSKGLSGMAARNNMSGGAGVGGASAGGAAKSGAGKGMLRGGAGIGAAALGIGAGIGLAAVGIGKLAESMAMLDKTQIWALPVTVLALAAAFAVFVPALIAVGTAGTVSSVGLLSLGAAALGIGAGIGIAAAGIGYMAEGMSSLKDVDMLSIGAGIAAVGASAIMATLGFAGMAGMTASILLIATTADDMERVGNAFTNIGAVMSGSIGNMGGIKDTLNSISSMDVGDIGINNLATLLSKPLTVQFAENEVSMIAHVDVSIDGDRLANATSQKSVVHIEDARKGQGTLS